MRSERPKVVHEIAGRPLIHYPLIALERLGADPSIVVVGYGAGEVQASCARFPAVFALQEEQRGTGHAVLCALPQLGDFQGEVLLLYADLPLLSAETLEGLVRAHRTAGATLSLLTAEVEDPSGFGRIVRGGGGVAAIVEHRDASPEQRAIREVNVGIYCTDAAFLRRALPALRADNAQGELYLTDIVAAAVAEGGVVAAAPAPVAETAQVNWRGELAEMEREMRARINRQWMEAGVTLEDPATTYIGAEARIGPDTVIGPGVLLRGRTRVGARCRIDGNALLRDTVLGDGVHVKFAVVLDDVELAAGCDVGPFAHLRGGSRLGERVSIGNFVETKNAEIGAGTKARHLAYLGDAEIGRDANIGAGTITCNYDGFRKHRTIIGDRVQVGSDSQLVAPVNVGDDAYIATATTVRRDVPAGALVFNSRDQLVRPGWVAARRARETGERPAVAANDKSRARRQRAKGAPVSATAKATAEKRTASAKKRTAPATKRVAPAKTRTAVAKKRAPKGAKAPARKTRR